MAYNISQQETPADNRRTVRWIMFLTFVHTVPSIWFLVAIAGLAPTSLLLAVGLAVPFFSSGESWGLLLFILLPSALYCLIYYGTAHLLSLLIGRLSSRLLRTGLVALIAIPLLVASFYPIYPSGGHGSTSYHSIVDLWQSLELSLYWLYSYTVLFGLVQSGLLLVLFWGGSLPVFSISNIWGNRRSRSVVMVFILAIIAGVFYVNRVLLVCRPFGNLGIARAQVCMGRALQDSNRNRYKGKEKAKIWFERAAVQGNSEAAWILIRMSNNSTDRRRWLGIAAENDDGAAQYELFVLSLRHDKSDQDRRIGSKWLLAAAENGETRAQYELSRAYLRNNHITGISKDIVRSRHWLEMAAEQEHPQAMRTTANNYENGTFGFPLDLKKAKYFYLEFVNFARKDTKQQHVGFDDAVSRIAKIGQLQKQLDKGDLESLINQAFKHLKATDPGPGARERGIELLQQAADLGDLSAQYDLGMIYLSGNYDIPKDLKLVHQWWQRAAEGRHVKAMEYAADGYTNGNYGFEIDHLKAKLQIETLIKTYRKGLYNAIADERKAHSWEAKLKYINRAMVEAGGIYQPKDILRTKSEVNDPESQFQLARQLASESKIKHGHEVFELYKKAAARGHIEAQFELFRLLQRGLTYTSTRTPGQVTVIVQKSDHQSLNYLRQAATGHHPKAMATLALAYEKGRYGLAKDYAKARDLYEAIIVAVENDLYGWNVDKYFIDMQRSRHKVVISLLKHLKERQDQYDNATQKERQVMDIKEQYGKKFANQYNAICRGNPYCTSDYIKQESARIRQKVFSERDRKIAELKINEK